ncbi:unnamed protein product [Anisakis simplex]|uniref:Uncharacterized protein n=1 Tax=Anisakis simplex TaxID=6269 RepID=A0A3P6NIX6_ANISI|nr:unnamed protein product [Anisakis simplex]
MYVIKSKFTVPHYTNAPISKDDPRAPQFAKAAELFRKMIDTTVDPCNDFYKFTCGKFDRSKTKMSFEEAELYNLIVMLLQFRDASHPHPKLPKPVQQVFYLYDKCLWATQNWKLATNNFTYTESKLKQYQQATGLPFPLLHQTEPDPAMPNRTLLAKAMGYLDGVFGTSSLISSFIDTNWKFPHSTQGYMLFIDQSSLTLPIPVYKKLWNEQYSDYFTNMTMGMFNMIRPGLDQAKLRTDVKAIYELEYTIAINVTTDEKTRRRFARSYNRYSLVEANAEFKFIDWSQYFNQLSTYADPDSQNKIRSNDFEFIIMEPSILHKLAEYIEKGKFTPRTIVNYLYFRVAKHYEAYLPNGAQQRDETVEKIYDIFGKDDFDMRPKRREWRPIVGPLPRRNRRLLAGILDEAMCIGLVNSNLDYASGRIFIDALFPNPAQRVSRFVIAYVNNMFFHSCFYSKRIKCFSDITTILPSIQYDVHDMMSSLLIQNKFRQNFADFTESILDGFRSMLDELEWMDRSSKSGAFNKVRDLVKNIAYPNFLTDDALLSEHYASLELSKNDTFLTMLENIYEFNMRTEYAKLRAGPSQRNDFGNTPDVVNAWYQPEMNSITIPAGIIRYPFYNPMWPAAVNYGSMGVIIGHELTHGFDDHGVQWDGTGVLYQWMDNSTFKSFENMAQCVVDEYNGFCPFPSGRPKCLDGSNTQGENIADNGGIHAAYRAFKTYQNLNGPEPAFDDALMQQFTPDQLFFMSFAQVWCEKASSASGSAISILLDPHSPSKYRVFGTIQNFPAFRSAFSCPLNSEYAPKKHCDVWISPVKGTYGIPKAPKPENALNILPAPRISPAEEQKHKGYTEAVQLYKQSMNLSADPCNNFYDYVCGSYNQPLSFTKGRIANYRAMSYQMELPRYKEVDTPNALKKLIQFYDTCKSVRADFGAYIKDGEIVLNAIEDFKTRTQLKFSMIESQSTQSQQTINAEILGDAIGYLSSQGIDTLISAMVDTNWTHPQHYCFYIDQNVLYYSKTYYSPIAWPTTYPSYKSNTIDLFNHYAALKKIQLDQTTLAKDVEKLLDFERTLAQKYSTSDTERRHFMRSYNPYNKQNATEPFKFINLASYFAGLSSTYPTVDKEYFSRSDLVFIVMEPQMIHKLSADFNTKFDSNTVANYLFYRILAQHRQYLPRPSGYKLREVEPHREHMPFLGRHAKRGQSLRTGITDAAYREPSVQCAYETLEILQYANARIFVDYSYPNKEAIRRIRQQVGGIIENILMSFRGMLNRLEWMDQRTKRGAYEKITDLKQNIAFPDFILDNEQLDSYYADLHYAPDDKYYDMIKETDKFNFELIYKVLVDDSTVNRNDFGGPPGTVNAWYYSTYNSITFPAGILHQPFFDENWPASLNYGGLGLVAGHELTHGFDDQGVQWNGVGALTDWMTDASMQGFNSMAHCVVQEYDHFCPLKGTGKMPDCVNGEQTQGENIADNGGIHAAWRAYKDHISQYGPDPQLPDPLYGDFTNDQLYFMSFAQVWCETPRSIDAQYRQIMTDPHSPSRYRVFGTIQNFPGFREAFNCPLGSAYGPKEHCSVWVPKTGGQ